jgi:chorismate dehydratase
MGYNSLVACETAGRDNGRLIITGLEIDRRVVAQTAVDSKEQGASFDWKGCLQQLAEKGLWQGEFAEIELLWGDARRTVQALPKGYDLIWLDAFSPRKNTELWTIDFFNKLKSLLTKGGVLLSYSAAIPVRSGLQQAGFTVGETKAFGRDRGGTIAALDPALIENPLDAREQHLIKSSRGTPYRDPAGTRSKKEILRAREYEILKGKDLS